MSGVQMESITYMVIGGLNELVFNKDKLEDDLLIQVNVSFESIS